MNLITYVHGEGRLGRKNKEVYIFNICNYINDLHMEKQIYLNEQESKEL